jgi:hypothetical protein
MAWRRTNKLNGWHPTAEFMKQKLTEEQILEIGRTYGKTETPTSLAKAMGVSKQRIQQVAVLLRKAGLPIPKIRLNGFSGAIEKLKQELLEGKR